MAQNHDKPRECKVKSKNPLETPAAEQALLDVLARADAGVLCARLPFRIAVALSGCRRGPPPKDKRARRAAARALRRATRELLEALPAALEDCENERLVVLSEAARRRQPLTEGGEYAQWRGRAEALCTVARTLQPRRGHDSRRARNRCVAALESLEDAMRFDEEAAQLLDAWREHGDCARAAGVPPWSLVEHRALLGRITRLAARARLPHECPPELVEALDAHRRDSAPSPLGYLTAAAAVAARLRDRDALLADARARHAAPTALAAYPRSRRSTEAALARAKDHWPPPASDLRQGDGSDKGWQRFAEGVEALRCALARDALGQELAQAWRDLKHRARVHDTHPLYLEGYEVLVHRIRTCLRGQSAHAGEIPPLLRHALREHEKMVVDRETVRAALRGFRDFGDTTEELALEEGHYGRRPAEHPRYTRWRRCGEHALACGRALLAEEDCFRAHLNATHDGFEEFLRIGGRIQRMLNDFQRNGAVALT